MKYSGVKDDNITKRGSNLRMNTNNALPTLGKHGIVTQYPQFHGVGEERDVIKIEGFCSKTKNTGETFNPLNQTIQAGDYGIRPIRVETEDIFTD